MLPPSLPKDIADRSWVQPNDEFALLPSDADAFLTACQQDGIEVLGWELWLVGIRFPAARGPNQDTGVAAIVPTWALLDGGPPRIFGGSGNAGECRVQLRALRLEQEIKPEWLGKVRINFTLAEGGDGISWLM